MSTSTQPSTPQPPPQRAGTAVPEAFRAWASSHGFKEAVTLSEQRDAFGQTKYGQPLMTQDGRCSVTDAMDEIGDLMHYVYKAKMNGENISPIKDLMPTLFALMTSNE